MSSFLFGCKVMLANLLIYSIQLFTMSITLWKKVIFQIFLLRNKSIDLLNP